MLKKNAGAAAANSTKLVRLGLVLWLSILTLLAGSVPLIVASTPKIGSPLFPDDYFSYMMGLVNASVGFLIVRFQPRQRIGWLFMALAVPFAVSNLAQHYALYGLVAVRDTGLPGLVFAAWLQKWLHFVSFPIPFAMLFMLFPDARLPSRKWRWVFGFSLLILLVQLFQEIFSPGLIRIYFADQEVGLPLLNPTGMRALRPLKPVLDATWLISILIILFGAAALLARYRNGSWAERQQLKWLVFFLVVFFVLMPFMINDGESVLDDLVLTLLILMLPAGTAIAILRYKLYGIDVIIRRTVQYTLLTGILAIVYFSLVLILQSLLSGLSEEQSPIVLVISTLAIATLFNPLRLRILTFIDRRFFRSRYDAEQILLAFSDLVRSEVDIHNLSDDLLRIVSSTIRPNQVSLWLRLGPGSRKSSPGIGDRSHG